MKLFCIEAMFDCTLEILPEQAEKRKMLEDNEAQKRKELEDQFQTDLRNMQMDQIPKKEVSSTIFTWSPFHFEME